MFKLLKVYSKSVLIAFASIFMLGTIFANKFSQVIGIESVYDTKRLLLITSVSFFSLGLCFYNKFEFIKISTITKAFVVTFFLSSFYSAFLSKYPFWSMVEIANIGLLINAFVLFTVIIKTFRKDRFIVAVFICALLFSIFTFVKYILFLIFSYTDAQNFNIHGLVSGYVNVRFFNQLQVMVIPLLFFPFFNQHLRNFRAVALGVMSLHWAVLLQTEARGGIISLLLSSCIILYFLPKNYRKQMFFNLLKTVSIGICLWLVFIIIIPYWLMDSVTFQIRTSSSGRLDLWLYILDVITDRIWFGFGPMSFAWAEGRPLANTHPHNLVMQLLYEYGFLICVVCLSWVINRGYKQLKFSCQLQSLSFLPVSYGVIAGLIYSLVSGVAVMPFAQLMLVFLVAIQVQQGKRSFFLVDKFFRIGLFISILLTAWFLLYTYKHEQLLPVLYPRIWINGLIDY
ncbi:O-antigen ligase family protein [Shewanella sp. 10N.286.48.B5]|uniref:O-antigen ligase family protein n=1 Tax=Shewanella sp. 10N.286.48.B5 TaxID=1880834 RepID=UPI000C82A1D1|nr:O-antigen ligase family protein [Shewanella sp. 10N.286.48.B5]PMH85331.1 polymerase [Shewanella sp. 10N.286.48.B5]